jgi:hypothetical protein
LNSTNGYQTFVSETQRWVMPRGSLLWKEMRIW